MVNCQNSAVPVIPAPCCIQDRRSSLDPGDASLSGEFLELKDVMSWHDAIRRAGKLDHAVLIADVGGVVGVGESGAGLVFEEIAIEVNIVGSEDE